MLTLKELRAKRAGLVERGRTALVEHNALTAIEARTAEQAARLAALDAELDTAETDLEALDQKILTAERAEQREATFTLPPANANANPRRLLTAAGQGFRTVGEPTPGSAGFKALSEFALSVRAVRAGAAPDPRLLALPVDTDSRFEASTPPSTWNQNAGSGGEGYLVPPDFREQIWQIAYDENDLLGMVGAEPTQANAVMVPRDETTPWGATGVQAYWSAETGQFKASRAQFTGALMNLHKLYAFVVASDELLADAPMLNDRLTRQAGRAIKWKASEAIFAGTGVGQPLGIQTSPALVVTPKDSGQATKTVSVTNIANMMARVLRVGGSPIWLANQDIIPQLINLTYGSGNWPAWMPNSSPLMASPWNGTLMGYPIMFTEHAQTLGTQGDLTLCNLDGYYAATKAQSGLNFAASIHLFFDLDETAFRWTIRLAGQPLLSTPLVSPKSTVAKSHFVTLAAR